MPPATPRSALLVLAALLLVLAAALHSLATPAAQPATAATADFSAARAMDHLRHIAAAPHPIGTAAHAQVLAYLQQQVTALGYQSEVQSGLAFWRGDRNIAGQVSNLVLRIPGTRTGKALLLSAHYDSAPFSPGAADNGAGVASVLETLRALKTGAPLQNDLVVVFTDGEEAGLLGAELFAHGHRWARDIGMVLNFDFRGNRGPFWMFQTSPGNGALIDGWATALDRPLGNALMAELYKVMPNDTDFTVYQASGMAGLNFAAIEGHAAYHTPLDNVDRIDPGSIQHEGASMLAATRHFGNTPLAGLRAHDRIYFNLPGAGIVRYTLATGWLLCAALLLAFGAVVVLAIKGGHARAGRILLAFPVFLVTCALIAAACQLLWMAICMVHPTHQLILQGMPYNGAWYVAAFCALSLGLYAWLQGAVARWLRPAERALGAMLCAPLLAVAAGVLMPGASFLFVWPALPMLGALAWQWSGQRAPQPWLPGLAAVPGILIVAPILHLVFFGLTFYVLPVAIVVLVIFLGMATPLVQALRQPYVLPLVPLLACAGLLAGGAFTSGVSAAQPQPNNLMFTQNAVDGAAYWVSDNARLDSWTATYFGAQPQRRALPALFGPDARPMWVQPAPALPAPGPSIRLVSDTTSAGKRMVSLDIASARAAPVLAASVDGLAVASASIQGHAAAGAAKWRVDLSGMGATLLRIDLVVAPGRPFTVRVHDRSYGLPAGAGPRPATMQVQPFGASDTVTLVRTMSFQ
jgi:hypothetical protein